MNGFNAVFMIQSVMAADGPAKHPVERRTPTDYEQKRNEDNSLFAEILGVAIKEVR